MARLLVVHHTVSPSLEEMLAANLAGAKDESITGVDVILRPALAASIADVLDADGFLLGTPANIGYMSGALKHFFDTVYYPCREATKGCPYAAYVHGNLDAAGAVRAIESIAGGMGWKPVSPTLTVAGAVGKQERDACYELGATLAATLATI
jgi:multimeric flavodoxin WrbA